MNALIVSTDKNIYRKGSHVRNRMIEYGKILGNLHIINFSDISEINHKISENVYLYPVNSNSKIGAVIKAIRLSKRIKNFDLISSQDPFELGIIAFLISMITRKRLHIQVHTDFMSEHFKNFSLKNRLRVFTAKFILKRAHGIRVVSERIKRGILDLGLKCDPIVLPILINQEEFRSISITTDLKKKYPEFGKIILTACRLEKEKNLEVLLQAFKKVLDKNPETLLIIVGDGSEMDNLKHLASSLSLDDNIRFEGYREDVHSYMKTADIYVQTSFYEGYGMSLVEAALLRLPIVSTRVGIIGDVLKPEKGAFVCEVGDVDCIADSLDRLVSDADLRYTLYMEALREVNDHLISKEEHDERFINSLIMK